LKKVEEVVRLSLLAVVAAAGILTEAAPAAASDRSDVVALIHAYNDAGNKGNRSGYAAFCTPDAIVVDHIAPYIFRGPTACADEYDAVVAWGAREKINVIAAFQKVRNPVFFEVDGDTAYAVFPVEDWFRQNGRPQLERLYLTTVLRREAHSWRIAAMTYSSRGWKPILPH